MGNKSKAEERFDVLSEGMRLSLAKAIFLALEYDDEGNPGSVWSSDTLQTVAELFNAYGVTFTPPEV